MLHEGDLCNMAFTFARQIFQVVEIIFIIKYNNVEIHINLGDNTLIKNV